MRSERRQPGHSGSGAVAAHARSSTDPKDIERTVRKQLTDVYDQAGLRGAGSDRFVAAQNETLAGYLVDEESDARSPAGTADSNAMKTTRSRY